MPLLSILGAVLTLVACIAAAIYLRARGEVVCVAFCADVFFHHTPFACHPTITTAAPQCMISSLSENLFVCLSVSLCTVGPAGNNILLVQQWL